MKYVSLDLETTSLKPSPDHILMVSLVVEDTSDILPLDQLPHFTCFVKQKEPIQGDLFALGMNGWILDAISGRVKNEKYPIYTAYPATKNDRSQECHSILWTDRAKAFLQKHFSDGKRITVAGKNVAGFDMPFLPEDFRKMFKHKVIDPGTLFVDWKNDDQVPGLEQCKERAGLPKEVSHDAYEDALDVIAILRKFYV